MNGYLNRTSGTQKKFLALGNLSLKNRNCENNFISLKEFNYYKKKNKSQQKKNILQSDTLLQYQPRKEAQDNYFLPYIESHRNQKHQHSPHDHLLEHKENLCEENWKKKISIPIPI